eukprot:894266-Prymnesium_polylepis.1
MAVQFRSASHVARQASGSRAHSDLDQRTCIWVLVAEVLWTNAPHLTWLGYSAEGQLGPPPDLHRSRARHAPSIGSGAKAPLWWRRSTATPLEPTATCGIRTIQILCGRPNRLF